MAIDVITIRERSTGVEREQVKPLSLLSILAASLILVAAAPAARTFVYDQELGTVARESLWRAAEKRIARSEIRRVHVRCYLDKRAFERVFEARFGLSASRVIAYYAGGADVHLRDATCQNVRAFLSGNVTVYTAAAYSILLHESLHRQGVRNERITTCLANDAVRWGSLWFGFDEAEALRARNLALTFTRLYTPSEYRMGKPNCLLLTRRTDWVDHRVR
jgi:hypothetical protein